MLTMLTIKPDKLPRFQIHMPNKGSRSDKEQRGRVENITKLLKEDPAKVQAIRDDRKKKKSFTPLELILKKAKLI